MAPITTYHFSLAFHPPYHVYLDELYQYLFAHFNHRIAFHTLISLRANLKKLAFLLS
jgi:hypothetical protein